MSNLEKRLKERPGIIPYFTFADPSIEQTEQFILTAIKKGVSAIEIGLPFSDPIADGPVIQQSHLRALNKYPNLNIDMALDLVQKIREKSDIPLIFMGAVNLIYKYGIEDFFKHAQNKGLSGIIMPDLNPEHSDQYCNAANKHNIDIIFLISPLCTQERRAKIVKSSTGFVYMVSRVGITGEQREINHNLKEQVEAIKKIKDIPVAIGFGVSKREHVETIYKIADAAIIGSHLVKCIKQHALYPDKQVIAIDNALTELEG